MVNEPRQTFIPKKTLATTGTKKKRSSGLFFGISVFIFVLTLVGVAGVYSYEIFLQKRIESLGVSLERAKAAFEPSLIQELKDLNIRMNGAESILDDHIAFSEFFAQLERDTIKTVRFNQFSYALDKESIEISMTGEAQSYSSLALQSDVFGESTYLKDPIFSNLGLDPSGNIVFVFTAVLNPSAVLYRNAI